VVQIGIFIYLFIIIFYQVSASIQFKPTAQEKKTYATIEFYRKKLIVAKRVEDDVWSASFPIIYAKTQHDDKILFYGVRGKAKYIGPYLKQYKYSENGFNGNMDLLFDRFDTSDLWVSHESHGDKSYIHVVGIANFVELGRESYACATFDVYTSRAIYNIKINDGCMYIKSLLSRWGNTSRKYIGNIGSVLKNLPEEAKEANGFVLHFHHEQPCHFFVTFSKDHETIHSMPLKTVRYKPSLSARGITNTKYLNLMGESFDGMLFQMQISSTSHIEQSVKYYEETNKIYPLKTIVVNENAHMNLNEFTNSKINSDMFIVGAHFKYDVTSQLCYIKTEDSIHLLEKSNVEFLVDGNSIKIVYKLATGTKMFLGFVNENYGALIENDAKNCGIRNAKTN